MKLLFASAVVFSVSLSFAEQSLTLPHQVVVQLSNGTEVRNGGYGSAMTAHPSAQNKFYALTDRGPNASYTGDAGKGKKFPAPDYTPRIGEFRLTPNGIEQVREILLKDNIGQDISGLPNPEGKGATGEIPYSNSGKALAFDDFGLDPEGLVALKDGTFWVSDEYGPHIVHYSKDGVELERINPFGSGTKGRKLPAVFANRRANRGMEGLAISPDESTLFGIMQSTMYNPSKAEATNTTLTRIVKFNIKTGATEQFLYRQEAANLSNSEIAAISDTEFLVVERDGGFYGSETKPAKYKRLYKIDLSNASDVSGEFSSETGLQLNGLALEQNSWDQISAAGIQPVTKTLVADLLEINQYPHDKLEGIWIRDDKSIAVLNDDDFAVTVKEGEVIQKVLPANEQIDSNILYLLDIKNY